VRQQTESFCDGGWRRKRISRWRGNRRGFSLALDMKFCWMQSCRSGDFEWICKSLHRKPAKQDSG